MKTIDRREFIKKTAESSALTFPFLAMTPNISATRRFENHITGNVAG